MIKHIVKTLTAFSLAAALNASAYQINAKYETTHYGVYEVILDAGENYDSNLKSKLSREIAMKRKFQSTAAVYPNGSRGMKGTINEKLLGVITTENYDGGDKINGAYNNNAKTSSDVGIYVSTKILSNFADNRTLNPLLEELVQMPLIITDFSLSLKSRNFRNQVFYTYASTAIIIDFEPIDSIYYTKAQYKDEITDKCSVNILASVDRSLNHVPFYIAAHGAVNAISCK